MLDGPTVLSYRTMTKEHCLPLDMTNETVYVFALSSGRQEISLLTVMSLFPDRCFAAKSAVSIQPSACCRDDDDDDDDELLLCLSDATSYAIRITQKAMIATVSFILVFVFVSDAGRGWKWK